VKRAILIVDDEERILFVLEHALKSLDHGLSVVTAGTAEQALAKVGERRYDLVITDLIMPDMDGIEFTERLRDLKSQPAIVWMTAYGCRSFQEAAERLNVYACVEKPLEIQDFRELAADAMGADGNKAEQALDAGEPIRQRSTYNRTG
jgi:DNA-binding NtrC family response regulator